MIMSFAKSLQQGSGLELFCAVAVAMMLVDDGYVV